MNDRCIGENKDDIDSNLIISTLILILATDLLRSIQE